MEHELECLTCLARFARESSEQATSDPLLRERALRRALRELAEVDLSSPPPRTGGVINRIVREETGNLDPFLQIKRRFNERALALLPRLRSVVAASSDPLATAVRLAIAGNVIDFASGQREDDIDLNGAVDESLAWSLDEDVFAALRSTASSSREVLYLLDNAGEVVFDRLLIEQLGPSRVTAVVRGSPTLNDVTRADAVHAGLEGLVPIIDSGSDIPGIDLERVRPELRTRFERADLVISKGQGNFETLEGEPHPGLFFLLRAKCGPVARRLGKPVGSVVLARAAVS